MPLHSISSASFISDEEDPRQSSSINENKIIDSSYNYSHHLKNKEQRSTNIKRETTLATLWKTHNSLCLVLFAVFEAIVVIILESFLFARFTQRIPPNVNIEEGLTKGIPVYLVIFIISLVFQVALAWDAVRNKNTIQVIAFNLFNLCCFSYAVFQFKQIARALKDTLGDTALVWELQKFIIANPIIIGICQLAYFYLGARLYLEFGWRIYKKIGADPDIRDMYRWYQIFLTILKLDFFFFLGFSVQYLVLVLQKGDAEYPLTIVALPLICIGLLLAVYAVKHESKQMIMLVFVGLAAGVAYFIFKICRMYDDSQRAKYLYVKEVLTFFACATLFLLLLTSINAAICWRNFDKGLKPQINLESHVHREVDLQ